MERPSRAAYAAPWFEKAIASVASAIDGAAPNNPAKLLGRKRSPRTAKAETANPPMKKRMRYSITPFPLLCFHKGPRFTKPHERLYTFPGVLTAAREPSRSRTHGRDNFCQYFCATDRGPRMLQRRREALQHAFFKCSDHRFVHIAFAADRRGIGELIGGCGHRGTNLPAALPPRGAGFMRASVSSTLADARRVRKSFNEMRVPAISRKHVFTSCAVSARSAPLST